jgi:hypothetical protein
VFIVTNMASPAVAVDAEEGGNRGNHVSSTSFVLSGETVVVEGLIEGERITKNPGDINGCVEFSSFALR